MTHSVRLEPLSFDTIAAAHFVLRQEELNECDLLKVDPISHIANSANFSIESCCIFIGDDLVAVWGHGPNNRCGATGTVWMMTTTHAEKYKYRLAKLSLALMEYLLRIYVRVEVMVFAYHLRSMNWLDWLGFKKELPAVTMFGVPMIYYWKDR